MLLVDVSGSSLVPLQVPAVSVQRGLSRQERLVALEREGRRLYIAEHLHNTPYMCPMQAGVDIQLVETVKESQQCKVMMMMMRVGDSVGVYGKDHRSIKATAGGLLDVCDWGGQCGPDCTSYPNIPPDMLLQLEGGARALWLWQEGWVVGGADERAC